MEDQKDAYGKYEVVISGISGRYPESANIDEFWNNLMSGTEMCVADDRRWPVGYCKLPEKSGKIPKIEKFDGDFFNYTPRESDLIDAQFRVLHETAFEAFLDGGNDPSDFEKSTTSVFTGWCYSDCESSQMEKAENIPSNFMQNCASRLSLNFGFTGSSMSYDTACASSFTAFHEAVNAMRNGVCETALVGGVTICLRPYVAGCFQSLQMIGKDGRCKCLDVRANGYVRSEAVVSILLQRKSRAKRYYAQVLNTKTNTDGYKDVGITFPSADSMLRLMTSTFDEVGIDPVNIKYIEGHVTGTQAGDPVECEAITKVFCPDYRPDPLLMGCMKSNMGHSEGSSGVCSVSKSCLIFQRRVIPPNINYVTPNPNIEGLISGKLKPVLEPTPFHENIIALNSFGFGGANVHTIIKANPVNQQPDAHDITGNKNLPRLLVYKCRHEDGYLALKNCIESTPEKITRGFLDLLHQTSKLNPKFQLNYRSYFLLDSNKRILKSKCDLLEDRTRKTDVFLAMNINEQVSIPSSLMEFSAFKEYLSESLKMAGQVDLNCSGKRWLESAVYHVSLCQFISSFGLKPRVIQNDPSSYIMSLFAQGSIKKQVILKFFNDVSEMYSNISKSSNNISSSGDESKGNTNGSASRTSKAILDLNGNLDMKKTFESWIKDETIQVNGLRQEVNDGLQDITPKSIVVKTSISNGHKLASDVKVLHLDDKTKPSDLLEMLGTLFLRGSQINIEHLYSKVTYPVPRETASISPLIKWDHSVDRKVYRVPDYMNWRLMNKPFDLNLSELFTYASGHVIDGRILFPAAGYLWLIWQSLAIEEILQNLDAYLEKGVEFRDVKLHRATIIPKTGSVRVKTCINSNTGWFEISDDDTIICNGYARLTDQSVKQIESSERTSDDMIPARDFYKELRVRGYEYKNSFQGVTESYADGTGGNAKFLENWVCFCDAVFQLTLLSHPTRELILPTGFDYLACDIRTMMKYKKEQEELIAKEDAANNEVSNEQKDDLEAKRLPTFKVNVNKLTHEVSTVGLYIKGMQASPAPRKKQNANLRAIKFFPFDQEMPHEQATLETKNKYMDECREVFLGSNSQEEESKVEEEQVDESRALLSQLKELKKKNLSLKETISELKEVSSKLANDLLVGIPTDQMALEHLMYIVSDNFYEKELEIYEVNLSHKSSLVTQVKQVLNNLRIKSKYNLIEELKPTEDSLYNQISTIDAHLKSKQLDGQLVIVQHPSMDFSFLVEEKLVHSYESIVRSSYDQLEENCFLMTVMRTDVTQLEKDLFSLKNVHLPTKDDTLTFLTSLGFFPISTKIVGNHAMILSRKPKRNLPLDVSMVETETFNMEWVDNLKQVMFNKSEKQERIWIRGADFETNGLMGFMNCLKKEDPRVRGFLMMSNSRNENNDEIIKKVVKSDLLVTVYKDKKLGTYLSCPVTNSMLTERSNEAYLDVESKGDLSSLKYYSMNPNYSDTFCTIDYSALNFKDVMVASGRVPLIAYPESFRDKEGNLGMEFSGRTKNGRRIMGFVGTNAIATGIDVKDLGAFLWDVPNGMTLEEAATIPVVYSTVYYALVMRGKLRPQETVLIHAGSGGVGQAAINVCLSMGCKVFTTVGSQEKREFIKKTFPSITDDRIFNSRSVSFADDILIATDGRGVDVVLNSLADEKLVAGIGCLAESGRFVEIGKYDLISDHPLDPKLLFNNQTFEAVCLAYFMEKVSQSKNSPEMLVLRDLMDQGLKRGIVKPLARHVFNKDQAEEAFRFMATGKHTGKVLLKMSEDEPSPLTTVKKITINSNKSYIVIGGLGGFGLEVCYWLVKKGARKLFVTSRSGCKTVYQKFCIQRLRSMGAQVVIATNDVSQLQEAADLIDKASSLGPVGGIFNVAMVLKDGFFENQTKETFEECCAIKIKGTDNLDQISRIKCPQLEHFVCFSSLVSSKGNLGQSNYAFANSSMDLMCEKRKASGLPGLSVQWGVIGDVGHVAEHMGNETIIAGSVPQRILSCFEVLEKVMFSTEPIIGSAVEVTETMGGGSSEDFLSAILNVLGLKDASGVDPNATLGDLGLDSLMAVEIKQLLEKNHDIILSTKEIRELKIQDIKNISSKKGDSKSSSSASDSLEGLILARDLPTAVFQPLNSQTQGDPLFVLPPIEGDFTLVSKVMESVTDRPVVAINWIKENESHETFEQIASFYLEQLKQEYPLLMIYDIVGYSLGSIIALEMAIQLQSQSTGPKVGKLVSLDLSPEYGKSIFSSRAAKSAEKSSSGTWVDMMYDWASKAILNKTLSPHEPIKSLPDNEDMQKLIALIKHETGGKITDDMLLEILERYRKKWRMANIYAPKTKYHGAIKLIRATSGFVDSVAVNIAEDYGLSKVVTGDVAVVKLPGDHRTFMTLDPQRVADEIKNYL